MEQDEALSIIEKLREEIARIKAMPEEPVTRNFGPNPPYEDWDLKCAVCGCWTDVNPCDLCCQEGYVECDEDGVVEYGADDILILKKFERS
jgi:hypothetical protein